MVVLWFIALAVIYGKLAVYSQSPEGLGTPPMAAVANVSVHPEKYTLAVYIHPKCPCTQATLYEVERLMTKVRDEVALSFYIFGASDAPSVWFEGTLDQLEQKFPDSLVIRDIDGEYSKSAGASVSGSTVLYTPDGVPVFWGGVTSGRGHSGDNLGSDSILSIARGLEPTRSEAPVYGCRITDDSSNNYLGNCSDESLGICPEPMKENQE